MSGDVRYEIEKAARERDAQVLRDLRREYPYAVESFMRTDHATMTPDERDFVERTLDRREDG